jgi:DNA-binding transcriptional LysR family regulator
LAARALNISQPAISKTLRQMEEELRLTLFSRAGGRLLPTPEAEALYPEATKALRGVEVFREIADTIRDGQAGAVSIAAIPTFTNSLLPEAIALFQQSHPSVRISVHAQSGRELVDSVQSGLVDFGLLNSTANAGISKKDDLGVSEIVCILPKSHPLTALSIIRPPHLLECRLIGYNSAFPFCDLIAHSFSSCGLRYNPHIEVGSSILLSSLINSGAGVGLIEPFVLMAGRHPNIVVRRFKPTITISPRVLYPPARPLSATAQNLVRELKRVARSVEAGSKMVRWLNSRADQPAE